MKKKLSEARKKGRGGWQNCHPDDLSRMLREHVEKGDPRDVANFCMFLWSLGYGIAPATGAPAAVDQGEANMRCQACIDRRDGVYGSYAAPCPVHHDDGNLRAAKGQEGDGPCRPHPVYRGPSNCNRGTVGCLEPGHRIFPRPPGVADDKT